MDYEKDLVELSQLLDRMLGENEPSDEELGYDLNLIELYDELHNVKEWLEGNRGKGNENANKS